MSLTFILGASVVAFGLGIGGAVYSARNRKAQFIKRWREECRRYELAAQYQDPYSKFSTKQYEMAERLDEGRDSLVTFD